MSDNGAGPASLDALDGYLRDFYVFRNAGDVEMDSCKSVLEVNVDEVILPISPCLLAEGDAEVWLPLGTCAWGISRGRDSVGEGQFALVLVGGLIARPGYVPAGH